MGEGFGLPEGGEVVGDEEVLGVPGCSPDLLARAAVLGTQRVELVVDDSPCRIVLDLVTDRECCAHPWLLDLKWWTGRAEHTSDGFASEASISEQNFSGRKYLGLWWVAWVLPAVISGRTAGGRSRSGCLESEAGGWASNGVRAVSAPRPGRARPAQRVNQRDCAMARSTTARRPNAPIRHVPP